MQNHASGINGWCADYKPGTTTTQGTLPSNADGWSGVTYGGFSYGGCIVLCLLHVLEKVLDEHRESIDMVARREGGQGRVDGGNEPVQERVHELAPFSLPILARTAQRNPG